MDDLGDVTLQTMCALAWGNTFAIGALINGALAGLAAYFLFLLIYQRCRPHALRWLIRRAGMSRV